MFYYHTLIKVAKAYPVWLQNYYAIRQNRKIFTMVFIKIIQIRVIVILIGVSVLSYGKYLYQFSPNFSEIKFSFLIANAIKYFNRGSYRQIVVIEWVIKLLTGMKCIESCKPVTTVTADIWTIIQVKKIHNLEDGSKLAHE